MVVWDGTRGPDNYGYIAGSSELVALDRWSLCYTEKGVEFGPYRVSRCDTVDTTVGYRIYSPGFPVQE